MSSASFIDIASTVLPASIQGTLSDLPESSDIVETKQKYALVMLTVLWDVQGGNLSARSALLFQ